MAYRLSKRAIQKVKKTFNKVDRTPASLQGETVGGKGAPYIGFYAKITAVGTESDKYSWERLEANTNRTFTVNSQWGSGDRTSDTGYATEVNGSKFVLKDSIVWLVPAFGQDYFVFEYSPSARIAKTGGSTIAAATDGTLGNGLVSVYKVTSGTRTDTNFDIKAYNTMGSEIAADTWIQITYNQIDGIWLITAEDCDS